MIHPGRWETFGLVLLEAQGCGLPVVGFRGGAMEEQAAELDTWSSEKSSSGLAEAVIKKALAFKEGDRTRAAKFVTDHFSWERTFARQMEVYERRR